MTPFGEIFGYRKSTSKAPSLSYTAVKRSALPPSWQCGPPQLFSQCSGPSSARHSTTGIKKKSTTSHSCLESTPTANNQSSKMPQSKEKEAQCGEATFNSSRWRYAVEPRKMAYMASRYFCQTHRPEFSSENVKSKQLYSLLYSVFLTQNMQLDALEVIESFLLVRHQLRQPLRAPARFSQHAMSEASLVSLRCYYIMANLGRLFPFPRNVRGELNVSWLSWLRSRLLFRCPLSSPRFSLTR